MYFNFLAIYMLALSVGYPRRYIEKIKGVL